MAFELNAVEARVLGSLIEKENTTPDYYPLTLNGLMNACNQKSSREPVMALDDNQILRAIDSLRDMRLAWMVQSVDARVPKYEHNFDKELGMTLQETAVMCVLLLRGPQTIGELRSRTNRIYPFESLDEVSVTIQMLMDREEPLVMKLPLQPGRKEARFSHLLSGEPDLTSYEAAAAAPVAKSAPAADPGELEQMKEENAALREELNMLGEEVDALRQEVETLKSSFAEFKAQFE